MSVTVRTNRATNPNVAAAATNYSAVAGTGGTASGAYNSGTGYDGAAGFYRVSWTVATTAASGGANYLQTGLAQNTQYTHSIFVRASKAITVRLTAQYQNSSSVNVGAATNGTAVALTANTWAQISVTATSGSAVDRVVLSAAASSGLWANGDTFDVDCLLIETAATVGTFFDGSYVNAAGVVYAWSGTANASTSTATAYQPVIILSNGSSPSSNVVVTFQDFDPGTNVVNIWRTIDGSRRVVRGARRRSVVGSDFVTDYEVALGRTISYDMEILSGVCAGVAVTTATTSFSSPAYGWLSDPLVPGTAVAVYADSGPSGEPGLDIDAISSLGYEASISKLMVIGTTEPVAFVGQRQAAQDVDFNMTTGTTGQASALRTLIKQAGILLFRPLPGWSSGLPGLCYVASSAIHELPVNEKWGGQIVTWKIKGSIFAPPAAAVVIPTTTYGTVSAAYTTYSGFVAAHPGQLYLDVIKNP